MREITALDAIQRLGKDGNCVCEVCMGCKTTLKAVLDLNEEPYADTVTVEGGRGRDYSGDGFRNSNFASFLSATAVLQSLQLSDKRFVSV